MASRRLRWRGRVGRALLLLTAASLGVWFFSCKQQLALLLTIKATSPIETFDLRIKDTDRDLVVLERIGEKVDPSSASTSGTVQEVKVSVEFTNPGRYLVYVRGLGSAGAQVALRLFEIEAVHQADLPLVLLPGADDADKDGFPRCRPTARGLCEDAACEHLDCDDKDPLVHPFGKEICGNGKDDDCSAGCGGTDGDEQCQDADGDGSRTPDDCDDTDPCRSPLIKEAANFCKTSKSAFPALPQACLDKLWSGQIPKAPFCGDKIDQDCDGQDITCISDEDCDGSSPPSDCDDTDAKINSTAKEVCDGKDNNCDGNKDEGCIPCDVDGDGYAMGTSTDPSCTLPKTDPDDYDAGIHPASTKETGGLEGGSVLMALRQSCGYDEEKNSTAAAPLRHRDVDHDGDKLVASSDGCPTESCDTDGDGFENAGCSPPKSQLDCDDTDAKTFPGAPDRCGDGKAQNCVADAACTCDKDQDGYCPAAVSGAFGDCNDSDSKIYPWATEICDHVDNDCDNMVDEGNPDNQGSPIPTSVKLCNDDNDGACAPACTAGSQNCSTTGKTLSGVCACSALVPTSTRDINNRVACSGESLTAAASPRCFGALQPTAELCNNADDNCKDEVTDDGKDQCQSTETCCSSQKACRNLKTDASNCSKCGSTCPPATTDRCYGGTCVCGSTGGPCTSGLSCTGAQCLCVPGTGSPCTGCCDGSSACLPVGSAQSSTKCGLGGELCQVCQQTSDCATGGICTAGVCGQVAASDGTTCQSGAGTCLKGSCCTGCVSGTTCVAGTSISACGKNGAACTACSTAVECKVAGCSSGSCVTSNATDGTACTGGTCVQGSCCKGCVSGTSCLAGTSNTACGINGAACVSCGPLSICIAGTCKCAGCLQGATCLPGTTNQQCGSGGAVCVDCTATSQRCVKQKCK